MGDPGTETEKVLPQVSKSLRSVHARVPDVQSLQAGSTVRAAERLLAQLSADGQLDERWKWDWEESDWGRH